MFLIIPAAYHVLRKFLKVFVFEHKMPKDFCDLLIRDYDDTDCSADAVVVDWAYKRSVRKEMQQLVFGFLQAKDAKAALEWKKNGLAIEKHDNYSHEKLTRERDLSHEKAELKERTKRKEGGT